MAKISHVVLPVSDQNQSRDWYVNKLGFIFEREQGPAVGIKDESGLIIFLYKTDGPLTGQKITLTIQVDDVHLKYEELVAAGVKFTSAPKLQFWGYGAEVLDPDGYTNHLWDEGSMAEAMGKRS
jgi:catechol 2,3-dioxygenase-like lactoylglutathione lyase family enzyme